jgi:Family of unknown function (DUF6335)
MTQKTREQIRAEMLEDLEAELGEDVRMDADETASEVEDLYFSEQDEDESDDLFIEDEELSAPRGGDVDVDPYLAEVVGEEAVGGTTPTPDQNIVEDIAVSAGIETPDQEILHTNERLEYRNSHRWELDPTSSEDYGDRREQEEELD